MQSGDRKADWESVWKAGPVNSSSWTHPMRVQPHRWGPIESKSKDSDMFSISR